MPNEIDYDALARQHRGVAREDRPPDPSELSENLKRSIAGFGTQLWDAAKGMVLDEKGNPISFERPLGATPTAMLNLAMGTANKMVPGQRGPMEEYPEAVGQYYAQRYAPSNIIETAKQDPIGTLADVSMVGGLVSGAARGASTLSRMANLPRVEAALTRGAGVANTVSAVTDPLRIGFNAATLPIRSNIPVVSRYTENIPGISRLRPEALYQSAMKPRPSLSNQRGRVEGMMETALEERLPVSEGAVKKGWGVVEDLQNQVQADVDAATARGVYIDPRQIAKRLDDVKARARGQMISTDDLAKLDKMQAKFLAQYQTTDPATGITTTRFIPADKAQEAKQGTYRKLKGKYGKEASEVKVEGLKALARGANEELRRFIPEITEPNLRQSKLIDFLPELQRAVSRTKNYQLLSFGTPAVASAAYALTGDATVAATAAALKAIFDHPLAKSKLAIAIYHGMKANPGKYGPARMATATARANEYVKQLLEGAKTPTPTTVP